MSRVTVVVLLLLLVVMGGYFWSVKTGVIPSGVKSQTAAPVRLYRWQEADGVTHYSQTSHPGATEVWIDPNKINTLDKLPPSEADNSNGASLNPLSAGPEGYVHQLKNDEQQARAAAATMGNIPDQEKNALDP